MKKYFTGYSLIELMIAMVLGLIILLSVMQLYLSASRTNRLQLGITEVLDSGRYALSVLENDIQHAGWVNIKSVNILGAKLSPINFIKTKDNDGYNGSDSITIQYEADTNLSAGTNYNCAGTIVAHGDNVINQYRLVDGALLCNGRELLDNVDSIQFIYGAEDKNHQPDGIVDVYLRADQIDQYENQISTIKIGILIRSNQDILDQSQILSFQVLDQFFPAANDKKVRRLFFKTIYLGNRVQAL